MPDPVEPPPRPAPLATPDGFRPASWYDRDQAPFRAGIMVRRDRPPRLLEELPPA